MSETFLDKVVLRTRERIDTLKSSIDATNIRSRAERVRDGSVHHKFRSALERTDRTNVIAEIKRASPSKGVINANIDITEAARSYESAGAAAVSVLTESEYFSGTLDDLEIVSKAVLIPVLRKDFIVDEIQVYEAAGAGADAVLLIVAALSEGELKHLLRVSHGLGIDALVEVHTIEEMDFAKNIAAEIIGINNRDLHSLEVSLDVSRRLIMERPKSSLIVAESGITDRSEIDELMGMGFNAFLIGETLMRADDIAAELRSLVGFPEPAI